MGSVGYFKNNLPLYGNQNVTTYLWARFVKVIVKGASINEVTEKVQLFFDHNTNAITRKTVTGVQKNIKV